MSAPAPRLITLADLLFTQGFGSRREVAALIRSGRVHLDGRRVDEPTQPVEAFRGRPFEVDGRVWPFHPSAVVMLHKPAGHECSMRPQSHPSVMGLLPEPLRRRGLQPVGRLDADTTGLLLLTDDGGLNHRLTSPRHHVHKVYEVSCVHPADASLVDRLLEGVELRDAPGERVRALACERTGETTLRLTLDEGRYHQVKRMVAAAGNRVQALHRSAFGSLVLPSDLAAGQWRWVDPETLQAAKG